MYLYIVGTEPVNKCWNSNYTNCLGSELFRFIQCLKKLTNVQVFEEESNIKHFFTIQSSLHCSQTIDQFDQFQVQIDKISNSQIPTVKVIRKHKITKTEFPKFPSTFENLQKTTLSKATESNTQKQHIPTTAKIRKLFEQRTRTLSLLSFCLYL